MAKRAAYKNDGGLDFSELTDFRPPEDRKITVDVEDLMTEEEKREADPLGYEPIWKWFYEELRQVEWKGWGRTLEVAIKLGIFAVITEKALTGFDGLLENVMLATGKYPTRADIDRARNQRLQMAKELTNPGSLNLPPISPPTNDPPISPPT